MTKPTNPLEFDSPWKEMMELYFKAFLEFFFPDLHGAIDWTRGYEFLDNELHKVVREAITGSRRVDKLVKVWLLTQQELLLYLHIEIQSQVEAEFAHRMFIYHYRLADRYGARVVSLAILGDAKAKWRPQSYHYNQFGCQLTFQFPIIKLLDYQTQGEQLERSRNPFSHVVRVHLMGLATQKSPQQRFRGKIQLYQSLTQAHYTRAEILELLRFLDWVLVLPEEFTLAFEQFVYHYEEDKQMRYVTSFEQRGLQRGLEQGLQQGLQQGREQGREQGLQQGREQGLQQGREQGLLQQAQEAVVKVLQVRFTTLPNQLVQSIQQLQNREQLSQLLELAVLAHSLEEFESQLPPQ